MTLGTARRVALCLAVFAMAVPSSAQVFTGRIDVTVTDSTGAILPKATVALSGPLDRTAVTDERGEVRFVNLPPGTYSVNARLDGFNEYTNTNRLEHDPGVARGRDVPQFLRTFRWSRVGWCR